MATTYLKLDYDRIVKDYPLAVRKLVEWFAAKDDIIQGLGAMEGEGDKYVKDKSLLYQLIGQFLPPVIHHDPRKLYEFFDDNNIRISIVEHPDSTNEIPAFTAHESQTKVSTVWETRQKAEEAAFYTAFNLLEISQKGD